MAQGINLNLPPAADLFPLNDPFSTQEERDSANLEKIIDLSLTEIDDFPDHPFKVCMDTKMQETIESIEQRGVLVPALVRPKANGRYEMVAGHRRKFGSEQAGHDVMPCIIRNLSDDEATIIMVDSNLQREEILPSEKAKAYKMKLDAMNRQGQRTDLTSGESHQRLKGKTSREILAEEVGEKENKLRQYITLASLVPELLQMVDDEFLGTKDALKIAPRPAEEIARLPEEQQRWVLEAIESEVCTPSHAQTRKMWKLFGSGRLSEDVIYSIMQEEKPNQVEKIKIPHDKISRFFPEDTPAEKITATIVEALELRQRKLERDRQRREQERGGR